MVRRRHQSYVGDASHIAGRRRSFPIASQELSAEDIIAHYNVVIAEGFGEFASDPVYLSEVVISANRIDKRRAKAKT